MNGMKENNKRHTILDVMVISSIAFVALVALLIVFLTREAGSLAVVEIDGEKVCEYSLSENGTFILNGGTNTLVIENGEAYMINSSCPDHTCENTGRVRYVGQTIICLPNRLSVTIKGESDGGVDFVS